MRRLLFSKWFFGMLAVVLILDLTADLGEHVNPQRFEVLNALSIALDIIALILALWMFIDLSRRRPNDGNHSRR